MLAFLKRILEKLKALFHKEAPLPQAVLPDKIEEALTHVDWEKRDVLVGSFRNEAQFRVCMEKNFYYIPADLIEEWDKPIHFVAAFQTPRMFRDQAGVRYYGKVLEERIVPRGSIHEVPQTHGTPKALYYRYEIEKWLPLETPILPRESAFVRAFTNFFLLENAQYVPELLLGSEEEYRLYTELKRREGRRGPGFALGETQVILDGSTIRLRLEDGKESRCRVQEFEKRPMAAFRRLYEEAYSAL